ncbi:MAG: DUF418 domain-containing protein [Marinilabiliaceae bacterium]
MAQHHLSPTGASERIIILDILRGFALLGILMVNMQWMNAPVAVSFSPVSLWESMPDQIADFLIRAFFESKFYVLFSLLFGYGFWLFLQKPAESPEQTVRTYVWRLVLLFFFGVFHVLVLWAGDILVWYALLGLLFVLFRQKSDKDLIKWTIGLLLVPVVLTAFFTLLIQLAMSVPEAASEVEAAFEEQEAQMAALIESAMETFRSGSFGEIFQMRLKEYGLLLPAIVFFYPNVLAMFLVGMYAARKGYLNNIEANLGFFRKLLRWGLFLGIPLNIIYGVLAVNLPANEMNWLQVLSLILKGFGGPLLTLGYVSAIVLAFFRGAFMKFFIWLAPVGRMALTNYLMQSIIAVILFHSYGFGLYGQVSLWQGMILTVVIFSLQIPFSNIWLRHFRFGPFEWLWRSLTYWKWQPMKR